jgi:hypothetical protein
MLLLIENADLEYPIWIQQDGKVVNVMHRIVKALLIGSDAIKVKVLILKTASEAVFSYLTFYFDLCFKK